MAPSAPVDAAILWFRKCLRIDDNAALADVAKLGPKVVCPIFIIDPHFVNPKKVGVHRYRFLLESLADLDKQLRSLYNSRLLVLRGKPENVLEALLKTGKPLLNGRPRYLMWERDTEPYALARDTAVQNMAEKCGTEVRIFSGHTLYDVAEALRKNKGKAPTQMPGMVTLAKVLGEPPQPVSPPKKLPGLPPDVAKLVDKQFKVPTLKEMGYKEPAQHCGLKGGEQQGLARLKSKLKDKGYICGFEKPKTRSTAFDPPSTTMLSPYLKFGCVSARRFYHGLKQVYAGRKHTQPPTSLLGQLYFREIAYLQGASIPNYDKQAGNPCCKQIPWNRNSKLLAAWEAGKTGYPFIDAAMRQLVSKGWLHHLARHAVACFLTRGDLWLSWEHGRDVFDKYLLDADWSLNNNNWLALSGVSPWSPPFFRVYHPVPKMDSALSVNDPDGKYIREFVPELRKMPSQYIYAPWTAPLAVQKEAGCVVGKDYPHRVVEHEKASKDNLARFSKALKNQKPVKAPSPPALSSVEKKPKQQKPVKVSLAPAPALFGGRKRKDDSAAASSGVKRARK